MDDKDKTKEELIKELKELRRQNRELAEQLEKKMFKSELSGAETILIVDDDEVVCDAVARMLNNFGYTTIKLSSPKEAIQLITNNEQHIDLVLSDLVMPEMSGTEMVNKIIEIRPDTKVIFMSGYADDEIISDDIYQVIHSDKYFIKKPFSSDEIGFFVRRAIDKKIDQNDF